MHFHEVHTEEKVSRASKLLMLGARKSRFPDVLQSTVSKNCCVFNTSPERKRKLRTFSHIAKDLVRTKHQKYLTKIEASFKDNPKHFWSYHIVFPGGRSGANSTISYNHEVAETPAGKAEIFNTYFCSVFLSASFDLNNSEYTTSSSITDMEISQIEVSVDEVEERLRELDTTKAYGPDKIPARPLKDCSEQIAPSLCSLFTLSLHKGKIPRE